MHLLVCLEVQIFVFIQTSCRLAGLQAAKINQESICHGIAAMITTVYLLTTRWYYYYLTVAVVKQSHCIFY